MCVSTTTVINILGYNKDSLINFYKFKGDAAETIVKEAQDIGSIVHKAIESHIKKEEFDSSQLDYDSLIVVEKAMDDLKRWEDINQPKYKESEYVLIDEEFNVGGTIDLIVELNGVDYIADWKTSKKVYREHIIQLSSYKKAYYKTKDYAEEVKECLIKNNPTHNIMFNDYNLSPSGIIFSINKNTDGMTDNVLKIHSIPEEIMEDCYVDFELALQQYRRKNIFNKFLKEINSD